MHQRLRPHLTYANIMATIAVFLVLGGTAYAAFHLPRNSVRSKHIKDGQVKTQDVANDTTSAALSGTDIANGGLTGDDVANGGLTGGDVANGSLGGSQIADGSLTGADVQGDSLGTAQINEASLGEVLSAQIGGLGRYNGGGSCNPISTSFLDCSIQSIILPTSARVLLLGNISATSTAGGANGTCKLVTNTGDVADTATHPAIYGAHESDHLGIAGITGVLAAGTHDFAIDCNETDPDILYTDAGITAVAISPD